MRARRWAVRESSVNSFVPRHLAAALRTDVEGGKAEGWGFAKPGELPEDPAALERWRSRRERGGVPVYTWIRVSPFQEAA